MSIRHERRLKEMQRRADIWNAEHPIGTPVRYWPTSNDPETFRDSKTRSEAWASPSGNAVVLIEGTSGGVSLEHVEVIEQPKETP